MTGKTVFFIVVRARRAESELDTGEKREPEAEDVGISRFHRYLINIMRDFLHPHKYSAVAQVHLKRGLLVANTCRVTLSLPLTPP